MTQPIPFGKYYLLERINVGGMAEVFKAKATGVEGFERMVAVKRILPTIAEDEEFITMFIDEAKIAVQLTHANIAQIFDLGKVDDSYFIALEYVHGKDLRAMFNRARARGEQLPIALACYVISKVCEGLDYAHNKRDAAGQFVNLVHRDVSPQNVLVSYEGEVKVIDFGIAKATGKEGRTQAGILKGKFGYMSPEQAQGFPIDRRSDVFGVGICLYELLTGERLFVGESDFATLERVRNVDMMPPSVYNRAIPPELERIVLKSLARERERRYATAMQLHDALLAFSQSAGYFCDRRELSLHMHRVFAEELQRETARDQEYAAIEAGRADDGSDLNAFDEIEPISTVSALHPQLSSDPRAAAGIIRPGSGAYGAPRPDTGSFKGGDARLSKATLLGMHAAPSQPPAAATWSNGGVRSASARPGPAVPPIIPRPSSIPAGRSVPPVPNTHDAPGAPPRHSMDWDEEEMSTQIYEPPEERNASEPPPPPPPPVRPRSSRPPAAQDIAESNHIDAPAPRRWGGVAGQPVSSHTLQLPSSQLARGASRTRALRPAFVLFALAAIVVVALLLLRGPSGATVRLSTNPADAVLEFDGKPIAGTSPFVLRRLTPGTTHEIVVRKQGYRPWSTKFELHQNEALQLPELSLEPLESGFALDSVPSGASVFVDGRRLEQTTPVRVGDLKPGDHQIRLETEGYSPWESSLQVTPGMVLDLPTAQLIASQIERDSERPHPAPEASAQLLPGRSRTPAEQAATPPSPAPQPRATSPASTPSTTETPQPASPVAVPAKPIGGGAEVAMGTLRVQTRPWSIVFVDGKQFGTTPQMNIQLPAGIHTLTFVNDEFKLKRTVKVQIEAGQVLTQVLTLGED